MTDIQSNTQEAAFITSSQPIINKGALKGFLSKNRKFFKLGFLLIAAFLFGALILWGLQREAVTRGWSWGGLPDPIVTIQTGVSSTEAVPLGRVLQIFHLDDPVVTVRLKTGEMVRKPLGDALYDNHTEMIDTIKLLNVSCSST